MKIGCLFLLGYDYVAVVGKTPWTYGGAEYLYAIDVFCLLYKILLHYIHISEFECVKVMRAHCEIVFLAQKYAITSYGHGFVAVGSILRIRLQTDFVSIKQKRVCRRIYRQTLSLIEKRLLKQWFELMKYDSDVFGLDELDT